MKHYKKDKFLLFLFVIAISYASPAVSESDTSDFVGASLVKEKAISARLIAQTKKIATPDSDIEFKQIVELRYSQSDFRYIVPVKENGGENRGCYIYNFDKNIQAAQKILLSKLDDAESCEIIAAVFSCNRTKKPTSGIGVLYGKRLGADNYWFEGSYFSLDQNQSLNEDKNLSSLLTDVKTVSTARKKLACH